VFGRRPFHWHLSDGDRSDRQERAPLAAPSRAHGRVSEREYACSRFQACFISSKVCGALASDATVDRFSVSGCRDDGAFGHVISLASGGDVAVTGPRIAGLKRLGRELGCDELSGIVAEIELELSGEALSRRRRTTWRASPGTSARSCSSTRRKTSSRLTARDLGALPRDGGHARDGGRFPRLVILQGDHAIQRCHTITEIFLHQVIAQNQKAQPRETLLPNRIGREPT